MYPIFLVFILGVSVIIYQLVRVYFDKRHAKPIQAAVDRQLREVTDETRHAAQVREIWETVAQHPRSELSRLLTRLCDLWQRDSGAPMLQLEIDGHINGMKEKYEIGRGFATLLSDTAGALGLLGTVLGMYETFMPGKLESSQIITGMGVALVTTIGGLVVSIFLNFAISWVHSIFYRHLEGIVERADLFRNRFGRGQTVSLTPPAQAVPAGAVISEVSPVTPIAAPAASRRIPTTLRLLSARRQAAEAGANLSKPLEVAVEDQHGRPIENLVVTFESNGSPVTFDNGTNVKEVSTDFLGRAKTAVKLGTLVGRHKVLARVNGEANLMEEFEIETQPGPPERLQILSGNLLIQPAGTQLPEPLSLQLLDAHGNPVPEQAVMFEVVHNNGSLDQNKARVEVHTDQEGIARVNFRLGEMPGANIVRAWVKSKNARRLEASFESLGKE
ncbi:MAG: MotA/TolQ/ExbB proton channel family protein [candidate division KSB1 bacterium]|nr:MotA/TolQ/ExbB proton channel family protein [candidate division KSB1 bacterium]MDZ7274645.1 MotA/TolQ/ExbB proton channel family protein [candidate division KSB1 bacterium]MDZ7285470.1 MotA/TolQ/ExbB proton channel family protein [candidate division KSB1 bacterium]MDZ7298502.1 MotA/TolQ/ExbB proton channel family protein [candidate division KSB1 bacterium]MDZ7306274.1 MotA/TolQ/ExbB proton channel family protein [candidate division KSB1 bacterium]